MTGAPLNLHPDRLFPAEVSTRAVARRLYETVAGLPIVSPHTHIPARLLAENEPFRDPASLLITHDHYVTRLLHGHGVALADLGVGAGPLSVGASLEAFRTLCRHWDDYAGTPVRYWLEGQFAGLFGITARPSAANAEELYERIADWIALESSRPRAMLTQFGIEALATTDDPCDDLRHHKQLADDPSFTPKVLPTFRPDPYLEPVRPGWNEHIDRLAEVSGVACDDWAGWVAAMENRRTYFRRHGAVSADHRHRDLRTDMLPAGEAVRIYAAARRSEASPEECVALRRHMVAEMARMSADDGLTMTMHAGMFRNHHISTLQRYGQVGTADVPVSVEVTKALRPVLNAFGMSTYFNLVVFTADESVWARELAPLAGYYPILYAGEPWWYLDSPDPIWRFRKAVTETAGFSKTSGFIDDTRSLCSIPVRQDMSRRLACGYLAELVVEHRLDEDEAALIARRHVAEQARNVFKM